MPARDAMKFITASDNAHSMPDASPVEINPLVTTREGHVLLTTRSILTTTRSGASQRVTQTPRRKWTMSRWNMRVAKSNLDSLHLLSFPFLSKESD